MFVMLGVKAANRPTALLSEFIYAPSEAKRSHDIPECVIAEEPHYPG
jgi:hypothetical protein